MHDQKSHGGSYATGGCCADTGTVGGTCQRLHIGHIRKWNHSVAGISNMSMGGGTAAERMAGALKCAAGADAFCGGTGCDPQPCYSGYRYLFPTNGSGVQPAADKPAFAVSSGRSNALPYLMDGGNLAVGIVLAF